MAKATKTIRQALHYPPQYAAYFAKNAALFNRVVAFYFECIQAHEGILALTNKAALGSARSFFSSLKKWRLRKEKYAAKQGRTRKKKPFRERPPVPPRTWN